jgi:hypothetical protein
LRRDARALGGYTLLALALTWPLAANLTRAVPGPEGDNWQQYWNVWWVKRALLELHQSPYHTPDLFHPGGADLHLHALNLIPVLLVLPLAAAFGLTVAYNVMALLSFVLGGHGAYRLCLSATVAGPARQAPAPVHLAAFFGGAVFTFSAYHFFYWQGPMALAAVQWLPYFAWQLRETHERGGVRAPLLAGILFVCAALSDWFLGLALLLFAAAFAAWHGRRAARRLALAMAGAGLLLAPVLWPALAAARAAGRPPGAVETARRLSGDLVGFVVPSPLHPLWQGGSSPVYRGLPGAGTVTTFVGFVPLALAFLAARRAGRRVRFWLVAALLFALLTLGPVLQVAGRVLSLPLPAALFYRVPFLDLLRSPGRFVLLVSLCLSVVSAAAVVSLLRRARWRRRAGALVAALLALALFENLAVPYPLSSADVPSLYHSMAREPGRGALLELPLDGVFPERMLHQTRHGRPVLGGYVARGEPPTAWDRLPGFRELRVLQPAVSDVVAIDDAPAAARAVLARHGVETIVVDKGRAAEEEVAFARRVLPALLPGIRLLADDPAVLAYRLPAGTAGPASFLHLAAPDRGWLPLEPAADPAPGFPAHFRWMEERGPLALHAARAGLWRIVLRGWGFRAARRVALLVDGRPVGEVMVDARPGRHVFAPFSCGEGWHQLELRSLDGAERASEGGPALSLAVAEIRLEALPALTEGARVALGAPAADVYVGDGWSGGEGAFRWTDGPRATLFVPRTTPGPVVLQLRVRPFLDARTHPAQRVRIDGNGRRLLEVELGGPTTLRAVLEPGERSGVDEVTLHLPDAAAPAPDQRALGLAVEWVGIEAFPRLALALPMAEALPLPSARAAAYLGRGWSEGEGDHRWTDDVRAGFVVGPGEPGILRMRLRPFLAPPRLLRQRMAVELDGRRLAEASLDDAEGAVHVFALTRRTSPGIVTLDLPDAASPASLDAGTDRRRLGVAAEWVRLDPFPRLALASVLAPGRPEAAPFLGAGWSGAEGAFRWTDGWRSELFLDTPAHTGTLLDLAVRPFLAPPGVSRQRVEVHADEHRLGTLDLASPEVATHTLLVPAGVLSGPSVLRFVLPDAVRPAGKGPGAETRRLGIAVHSLRLRPLESLLPQVRLSLGRDDAAPFLGWGWSGAEGALRWTDGPRSELFFGLKDRPRVLQLRLRPLLTDSRPRQRLGLRLNGRDVVTLTLTDSAPAVYSVAMPEDAYEAENRLELLLPDAETGAAGDGRRLGVAVYWVRLAPWF